MSQSLVEFLVIVGVEGLDPSLDFLSIRQYHIRESSGYISILASATSSPDLKLSEQLPLDLFRFFQEI